MKRQRYCFLIKVIVLLVLQLQLYLPSREVCCLKTFIAMLVYGLRLMDNTELGIFEFGYLQKGWLLWAGIGLAGAIAAIAVTEAAASLFRGESPEREDQFHHKDALVSLLPLIGSSSVMYFTSIACLLGITGVLAPILEETKFKLVCWKVEAGLTSNLPSRRYCLVHF
ncbi:unnamed protein product [Prunus armeniaca]|uniref:Uncharacterized protein n=1 Tax=Prunus armeniaca TaxID=36596 RepID=A0A6J5W112_PRUAR|nr:unnamed protein product [Prunus armeniaca]